MKTKVSNIILVILCSALMGCVSAHYSAELTTASNFKFEKGQRIAVLPVAVNGNPSLRTDAASTAAFTVHLAKLGYSVFEVEQLRLEAKKNGFTLPDTLNFESYPLIAKATGVELILQSTVDYVVTPSHSYSEPSLIYGTTNGGIAMTTGLGSSVTLGGAIVPRAQSMSIIDAASGSILARGYVNASPYKTMAEELTDALADVIWKQSMKY